MLRTRVHFFISTHDLALGNALQTCHKITRQAQSFNGLLFGSYTFWIITGFQYAPIYLFRPSNALMHTFIPLEPPPSLGKRLGQKCGVGGKHLQDIDVEVSEHNHIVLDPHQLNRLVCFSSPPLQFTMGLMFSCHLKTVFENRKMCKYCF